MSLYKIVVSPFRILSSPSHLTSCRAITFISYILVVSSTHCSASSLCRLLIFHVQILRVFQFRSLFRIIYSVSRLVFKFINNIKFYPGWLLALRKNPQPGGPATPIDRGYYETIVICFPMRRWGCHFPYAANWIPWGFHTRYHLRYTTREYNVFTITKFWLKKDYFCVIIFNSVKLQIILFVFLFKFYNFMFIILLSLA